LLQWEDFSKQKAFDMLERYRNTVPSFNDDIQGTGSVVLAGLLNAVRKSRQPLKDQVFLIHGAGAGGIGVAHQIALGLVREGLSYDRAKEHIFLIDSKGLVLSDRGGLEPYKRSFAHDPARVAGWQITGRVPSLLDTVREGGVTALIGLSGQRGAFSREVVEAVDANTPYPIVFPLSNPTANSEAIPEDIFRWTKGRAIVATGSPFDEVTYDGVNYPIGQGNNAFIFPGLGLGVMLSGARRVTDGMLTAAALALSEYTDANRVAQGGMYPRMELIRGLSRRVAVAVMAQAAEDGMAPLAVDGDLNEFVEKRMWKPKYLRFRRKR
jgi:malate dehydrogenase (oxaloacetate-decarboxylating)